MKFREQTAKKKSIRQIAGMFLAVTVLLAGSPYIAEAAEIVKDMDGTAYAQDAAGFVYQIPKGATTKKGCSIYMYTGEKSTVTFPAKCNSYVVTNIGTNLGQLILTNLQTVKIPSGYTTIETQAFQNQTDLYQIEIPASVKTIGIDAFAGCNKARLTIVTPYGSAAETYAKANEIHFDDQSAVRKAVLALANEGHSKIAIIIGEEENILSIQRFEGYLEGLKQAGIQYDEKLVLRGSYTRVSGYQVTKRMIAQEDQPTAVITCNNLLSKGYLQAVCEHTHGKTDLYTHIGLDEIDMMQYLGIPYNCIQRDAYELGRSAAELLMKRIEQPEEAYQHMILSSPLIHQTF